MVLRALNRQKRLRCDEDNGAAKHHGEQTKPKPPSHAFRDYNHPSEEEHRTAEQFSWRDGYRLNVGIAVVAVIGATFACGSFLETKRQANIAHTALVQGARAWIDVTADQTKTSLRWGSRPDDQFLNISITVKNKGSSPAIGVGAISIIRVDKTGPIPTMIDQVDQFCPASDVGNQVGGGRTLFANEYNTDTYKVYLPKEEISGYETRFVSKLGARIEIPISLTILVCASYSVIGDNISHRSARIYDLGTLRPNNIGFFIPCLGQDIPVGAVALRDWPYGEYTD